LDYLCSVATRREIFFLWRPFLRDREDDLVLELAVEASCDFIVTYNKRDFEGAEKFGIRVVTPKEFLEERGLIPIISMGARLIQTCSSLRYKTAYRQPFIAGLPKNVCPHDERIPEKGPLATEEVQRACKVAGPEAGPATDSGTKSSPSI
jgi:hypothetical protein